MRNHLYRPDGVITAEVIRALSFISTTQNPLSIFNEQYHSDLFKSFNKSLIRGMRYTISLVNWLTLRNSIHSRISTPFFFTITTIGDAHGEVEGHMVLADSNPVIRVANFSRNFGATGLTRCAIGAASPTSIS